MPIEDFSKKYTQTNLISRRIIANFYQEIDRLLNNLPIANALEVACGPGFSTQYLTKLCPDINWQASDNETNLVAQAREKNPEINISQESIYQLNRPNNNFDLVVALEVLEHLAKPEEALQELRRVTKTYCLVSVPREPLWRILNMLRGRYLKNLGNTPGHINHWSGNQLKKFVSPYFTISKQVQPLPWTILLLQKSKTLAPS